MEESNPVSYGGIMPRAFSGATEEAENPDPAAQDPPGTITMQESYPRSEDPVEEEDEQDENEPNSFIKMEESNSYEDTDQQSSNVKSDPMEEDAEEKSPVKQEEPDASETAEQEQDPLPNLGGKINKKAFCLLDGIFEVWH